MALTNMTSLISRLKKRKMLRKKRQHSCERKLYRTQKTLKKKKDSKKKKTTSQSQLYRSKQGLRLIKPLKREKMMTM